jgi:ubiquinone/menaquinone biosynthesis C-methylase UbiE
MLGIREGERVLEIGSGTGNSLLPLAQAVGRSGCVFGLDLSPGMLRVARFRLGHPGKTMPVHLGCGDAVFLPFRDQSCDAIFSSFTLELFDTPEIPQVLAECRRILRPGGRLCMLSLSRSGKTNKMIELYEWSHRRFPAIVDCRPIRLELSLQTSGFLVRDAVRGSLWGLPLEIVLAQQ